MSIPMPYDMIWSTDSPRRSRHRTSSLTLIHDAAVPSATRLSLQTVLFAAIQTASTSRIGVSTLTHRVRALTYQRLTPTLAVCCPWLGVWADRYSLPMQDLHLRPLTVSLSHPDHSIASILSVPLPTSKSCSRICQWLTGSPSSRSRRSRSSPRRACRMFRR